MAARTKNMQIICYGIREANMKYGTVRKIESGEELNTTKRSSFGAYDLETLNKSKQRAKAITPGPLTVHLPLRDLEVLEEVTGRPACHLGTHHLISESERL